MPVESNRRKIFSRNSTTKSATKSVLQKLPTFADKDIGTILKGVGMELVSTVGGASGPLYGTAFMKAGNVCKGKTELTDADFVAAFNAAVGGIQMRGKAVEGEKTMLDALCPAYKVLKDGVDGGKPLTQALAEAVVAASKGVEYTKTIIATKGRASYLKERSLGHQDPGATSSLYMLQTTLGVLQGAWFMVGIVIVSHSQKLAEGVVEIARMMAHDAPLAAAGGLDDGNLGTSYDKIQNAVESVYSADGVIVLMDMGSAVMTTEMVLEDLERDNVVMLDCPLVEGAVLAAVESSGGKTLAEISQRIDESRTAKKF